MKNFTIFAIFLFVGTSCHEATIEKCHCFVTISDALPIQFWPTGCASYNTANKCGVHDACWCAPVECDDIIDIPYKDSLAPDNVMFSEFESDLDGWENATVGGSTSDWLWSSDFGGSAKATTVNTFGVKTLQIQGISVPQKEFTIFIRWAMTDPEASTSLLMRLLIRDSANNQLLNQQFTSLNNGREQISAITVSTESIWQNAYEFEIAVSSSNFVAGDELHITGVELRYDQAINSSYLEILDTSSNRILTDDFVGQDVGGTDADYTLSLTPSSMSPDICDELIQMKIHGNVLPTDFNDWLNVDFGSGNAWSVLSGVAECELESPTFYSDRFTALKSFTSGSAIRFTGHFRVTESGNTYTLIIFGTDINGNELFTENVFGGTIAGGEEYTFSIDYDLLVNVIRVGFRISRSAGSDIGHVLFYSFHATDEIYYTDCIDVKTDQGCTTLIEYSNARNFAGLIYENESPDQTFQIRIPSVFFHERFPEEDEDIELPSSLLSLNSSLKAQRLLDTAYMPYYMHMKLMLVLKHQFITIDGTEYIKEEPYEIQDGDRRWPLKKAKCYLSEKNYVQRNIL